LSSGVIARVNGVGRRRADIAGSLIVVASWIQKGTDKSDQETDHCRDNDPINLKNERVNHWPRAGKATATAIAFTHSRKPRAALIL
jgi:hypothetical protein